MRTKTQFDPKTQIWYGEKIEKRPERNSRVSLGKAALEAMNKHMSSLAQINVNNGIECTYAELKLKTIRASQNLLRLGYKKDDIFGIIARNNHNFAPIVLAAVTIGTPFNSLDASFSRSDISNMFKKTRPKIVFCDGDLVSRVKHALNDIQLTSDIFALDGNEDDVRYVDELFNETGYEQEFDPPLFDSSQIAAITCSSGTTGLPKAVCISHALLIYQMQLKANVPPCSMLYFSSLYWISGILILLYSVITGSTRIVTTNEFSSELLFEIASKHKVQIVATTPFAIKSCLNNEEILKADLSSIRMWSSTGSSMAGNLHTNINRYLPNGYVSVSYGLTEVGGAVSGGIACSKIGSVGFLDPGVMVKIITENGEKCGIGEDGELYIKSAYPFLGYYRDQEATKKATDREGWFITGDIGHFDEELCLNIVGRKKEILKYCGHQISPLEIENVLLDHPGVAHACVVGIPDAVTGDLVAAAIVRKDGAEVNEKEIHQLVADQMSEFKQLNGGVFFVESIPTTPSGKMIRTRVKDVVVKLHRKRKCQPDLNFMLKIERN